MWLNEQGLGPCWDAFREENFTTLSSLFSLTSDELKDMGLKLGEINNFMVELDNLAAYSNDQLRSMGVTDSGIKTFDIVAQKYRIDKVTPSFQVMNLFINLSLSEIVMSRR